MDIMIAVALVLRPDGRTLLVRKAGTHAFQQPGGRIDAGEAAAAALCRELAEETGLRVDAGQMRALGRFRARAANEPGRQVVADLFLLHLPEETEIVPAPRSPRHAGSIRHATTSPSRR